jgi:hypothetical protein
LKEVLQSTDYGLTLIHRQRVKKDHFGVNSVAKLQ